MQIHRRKIFLVIAVVLFITTVAWLSPFRNVFLPPSKTALNTQSQTPQKIKSCEVEKTTGLNSKVWCDQSKDYWSATVDKHLAQVQIGRQLLEVELVNSSQSITLGLSGRESIGSDGMLFLFTHPVAAQFWMKEMKFDLDLVWLVNDKVIGITENVPKPDPSMPLNELPLYTPPGPVNMVLEIPAGQAKKWHLEVGDEFVWIKKNSK